MVCFNCWGLKERAISMLASLGQESDHMPFVWTEDFELTCKAQTLVAKYDILWIIRWVLSLNNNLNPLQQSIMLGAVGGMKEVWALIAQWLYNTFHYLFTCIIHYLEYYMIIRFFTWLLNKVWHINILFQIVSDIYVNNNHCLDLLESRLIFSIPLWISGWHGCNQKKSLLSTKMESLF